MKRYLTEEKLSSLSTLINDRNKNENQNPELDLNKMKIREKWGELFGVS